MDVEKFRNLTDAELQHQQRELNDQLFRLKFQLKMGQTESLNKIRGLRRDVARILTVIREKELGIEHHKAAAPATAEAGEVAAPQKKAKAKARPKARVKSKGKIAARPKKQTKAKARKK
jgi:large subunit ribosomal protein L29